MDIPERAFVDLRVRVKEGSELVDEVDTQCIQLSVLWVHRRQHSQHKGSSDFHRPWM
jgi:hypothetical protein